MTMLTPSEQKYQTAHAEAVRRGYRSGAELAIREALEQWARPEYPGARMVHELVMGRGKVRADMAAVQADNLAAFEIKSPYDDTTRLLHQAGMFRMAAPELWIVTTARHSEDAELMRWLMPSIGILIAESDARPTVTDEPGPYRIAVMHRAERIEPLSDALLSLCWVAELADEARRERIIQGKTNPTHAALVKMLTKHLSPGKHLAGVCRQLRARDALWRADPAIIEEEKAA